MFNKLLTLLLILLIGIKIRAEEEKLSQGAPAALENLCGKNCVSCRTAENGSFYCTRCYQSALVEGQCQETKDLYNCEVFDNQGCEFCSPGYGKDPRKTKLEEQCRILPDMAEGSLIAVFDKITPTRYTILACENGNMSPDAQTCVPLEVTFNNVRPFGCKYPSLETYSFAYERTDGRASCWRCNPHLPFGYGTPFEDGNGYHGCYVYGGNKRPNLGCLRTRLVTKGTGSATKDQMCTMCDFYIGYFMYAPGVCKNPLITE